MPQGSKQLKKSVTNMDYIYFFSTEIFMHIINSNYQNFKGYIIIKNIFAAILLGKTHSTS